MDTHVDCTLRPWSEAKSVLEPTNSKSSSKEAVVGKRGVLIECAFCFRASDTGGPLVAAHASAASASSELVLVVLNSLALDVVKPTAPDAAPELDTVDRIQVRTLLMENRWVRMPG